MKRNKLKRFEEWLSEGITNVDGEYKFDWINDYPTDLLPLKFSPWYSRKMKFRKTDTLYGYYYGYKIDNDKEKFNGINFLADIKTMEKSIKPNDLNLFIKKAILGFSNNAKANTYDTIISPRSSSKILTELTNGLIKKTGIRNSFTDGFIKSTSNDIELDMVKFNKIPERIKRKVMQSFKRSVVQGKPFKMKKIHPMYRKFFKNFLKFNSKNQRRLINAISGNRIILIDDYKTSGTTIKEMMRLLSDAGAVEVIVFILIKID